MQEALAVCDFIGNEIPISRMHWHTFQSNHPHLSIRIGLSY